MKTQRYGTIFLLCIQCMMKGQFSPGRLCVLQVGDGIGSLSGTGNPIIFREFDLFGNVTYSLPVPYTGSQAMVIRGNVLSEGYLSRSADNRYVVFGAYMQALPNLTTLNSTAASSISRGIALVAAAATISVAATCDVSALASGDIRGAAATNSNNVWSSSSSQGNAYYGTATAAQQVQNNKSNVRSLQIFNQQLYVSSQVSSGSPADIGVYAIGNGTPTGSAQTLSTVINSGSGALPGQFYFNPSGTICYVADARNSSTGGIQKWVLSNGSFSLAYTLPTGTSNIGAYGVVADFTSPAPKVYATTAETSNNRLIAIIDNGSGATATTIATASIANTAFRGLAWTPEASTCIPAAILLSTNNAPLCSQQTLSLSLQVSGSAPMSYLWTGPSAFSSTLAAPAFSNAQSGNYSVVVNNACGTTGTVFPLNIYISPTIQVNAASICVGGIATITATGANTYTWNNNSNSPSFTASPLSTTHYTVSGASSQGCLAGPVVTSIAVVTTPSISLSGVSICAGRSASLIAQGGSTYTWINTSVQSASLVVSPNFNTQYTVIANASGCANTVSAVATVTVLPLPNVSITNTTKLFCQNNVNIVLTK